MLTNCLLGIPSIYVILSCREDCSSMCIPKYSSRRTAPRSFCDFLTVVVVVGWFRTKVRPLTGQSNADIYIPIFEGLSALPPYIDRRSNTPDIDRICVYDSLDPSDSLSQQKKTTAPQSLYSPKGKQRGIRLAIFTPICTFPLKIRILQR